MDLYLVLILKCLFLQYLRTVNGACTFPADLTGTWRSSRWDDMVFTSSQVTLPEFQGSTLTLDCDTSDGTYYLIRSTVTLNLLGNNVEVTACLDLSTSVSGVKYIYYHANNEITLDGGEVQPVRLVIPGTVISSSDTCTSTSYSVGSNDVMVNTAALSDAVETCPTPLLANFDNYTMSSFSGTTYCDGVGYINICDDGQTVTAYYSLCSDQVFYSTGGVLSCVHSSSSGSVYYVNLLNNDTSVDNTATFHYTCVVIETTGTIVYATQYPRKCHSSQTSTSIPNANGFKFDMYTNLTCLPGSSGGFDIIPIIVAILLILIIAAACYYFLKKKKMYKKLPCYKKKKKNKKKENKVQPSGGSVVGVAPLSMDSKVTGLTPSAVFLPPDRSNTVTPLERRNLDTAQSTRSTVTVSHMDAEIVEDQTPRRLPPLEPKNNPSQESDTSDTPSMVPRLPPINESLVGANDTTGGDALNVSSISKSGASAGAVVPNVMDRPQEPPEETVVAPEPDTNNSIENGNATGTI